MIKFRYFSFLRTALLLRLDSKPTVNYRTYRHLDWIRKKTIWTIIITSYYWGIQKTINICIEWRVNKITGWSDLAMKLRIESCLQVKRSFLLKWNYGKLGDRYAIFLFFHFLNKMEKNEKMVGINIIFSFFLFSIFCEKRKNRKMS